MQAFSFTNNSLNSFDFCLFQQDPSLAIPNLFPLAWFSQQVDPGTSVTYSWEIDYSYVWSNVGEVAPGVQFNAAQIIPADLASNNQVTLLYNGAYAFTATSPGPAPGTLYITENGTIPVGSTVAVGIGMANQGTFIVQAEPNENLTFTPHPEYWVAFGTYSQGEVLDVGEMSDIAQVSFAPGVFHGGLDQR